MQKHCSSAIAFMCGKRNCLVWKQKNIITITKIIENWKLLSTEINKKDSEVEWQIQVNYLQNWHVLLEIFIILNVSIGIQIVD